ncbi:hypothetical protein GCM10020331_092800 [Ectobacillus funiculus]
MRAIGSGRNGYKATFRGNNLAVDLMRQPGSTFKPIFFDYGPAIEKFKNGRHIIKLSMNRINIQMEHQFGTLMLPTKDRCQSGML